jgi:hypothetical protein
MKSHANVVMGARTSWWREGLHVEPAGDTLQAGNSRSVRLSFALVTVLAVGTNVVVIVVAVAVVVLALTVAASMRGRQKRGAQRSDATRRELGDAQERAEHDRDITQEQVERGADPDR